MSCPSHTDDAGPCAGVTWINLPLRDRQRCWSPARCPVRTKVQPGNYWLTATLNALPAVNFTVFAAGTWIFAPVAGLQPTRAARAPVEDEPTPTSWTDSP